MAFLGYLIYYLGGNRLKKKVFSIIYIEKYELGRKDCIKNCVGVSQVEKKDGSVEISSSSKDVTSLTLTLYIYTIKE